MRKIFFLTSIFMCFATVSSAQDIAKNALGIRVGDDDGFGAEISYQRGLSEKNRLEFDLGWRSGDSYNALKVTGLYQWVWNIDGGFNWYAGAGGAVASFDFDDDVLDSETFFLAAGDIGIEYNFDIPLLISLDFRPEYGFGDFRDDLDFDIGLGIRYQF